MIYTYTLYIVFIVASVRIDAEHIENKQYFTDHRSRFVLRAVVTALAAETIWDLLLLGSLFYLVFDYLLNISVGNRWNYIGGTSKIDLFWRKHIAWQLPFKILLFTSSLVLKIIFI